MSGAGTQARPRPSSDKRWAVVEATMRRHGFAGEALIETLHAAQQSFAYLDETALRYIANSLNLPLGKVYGVATFYNHFTLKPQGKHTCVVCMGTACYIKGAAELLETLANKYNVKAGGTTADGEISVLQARCLGCCGIAPAVVFDGNVAGKVTPDELVNRVEQMVHHDA